MYDACPDYPYDLGVLVQSWKAMVCEEYVERNDDNYDRLNTSFAFESKHRNCKGMYNAQNRFISIQVYSY